MYYDTDADPSALDGQTVAVIGYGSQGHAHALNLRDSGVTSSSASPRAPRAGALAEAAGLRVVDVADAVKAADVIMIAVPGHGPEGRLRRRDRAQPAARPAADVRPRLQHPVRPHPAAGHRRRGHGRAQGPRPPRCARVYEQGGGVPALFAVEQDATGTARARVLAYARGIGSTRAGVLETTFKEETETDLFGEQALLCGGVSALIKAAFETLVEAGYQPELAYFETMHELKLIVDLMYRGGLNFMRFSVSDTAEYGDYVSGPRVTEGAKAAMKDVLTDIQSGAFAEQLDRRPGGRRRRVPRAARARTATTRSSRSVRTSAAKMPFLEPGRRRGRPGPGGRERRHPAGRSSHDVRGHHPPLRRGRRGRARSGSSTPPCVTASRRPAPA